MIGPALHHLKRIGDLLELDLDRIAELPETVTPPQEQEAEPEPELIAQYRS